jgi:hypothetical protein
MVDTYHRIAGITFRTEASDLFPFSPQKNFRLFQVSPAKADVVQRIHVINSGTCNCDPHASERVSHLMCSPGVKEALREALEQTEQAQIEIDQKMVIIRNFTRCEYDHFILNENEGQVLQDQFSTAEGRVSGSILQIFSTFLSALSAVMLHSAGLVFGEKAGLFIAPSGGGKSTTVGLSHNLPVLNDDRIILRQHPDGNIFAYSSPFGRITSGSCGARLAGIFLLEKAQNFNITRVSGQEVLEFFLTSLEPGTDNLPTNLRVKLFDVLRQASFEIPGYRLQFTKEYIDWDQIYSAMSARFQNS